MLLTFFVGKSDKFKWFTLVELIVVITILAILGTIGFISIQGYSSSARDSSRISNLVNLQKGLSLFNVAGGSYPMPESPITITASGTVIGYQGFARDQVAGIAKLSAGATRDPLDTGMYTTYATNALQTKMQVMAFLEDGSKVTGYVPGVGEAFAAGAASYVSRSPLTKGDTLGILVGTGANMNQPVQELLTTTFTGVDVVNTSTGYTAVFSKTDSVSGTGSKLVAVRASMAPSPILPVRDISLVGYWDMENVTTDGRLADISGNGNGWTIYWWLVTWGSNGKLWKFINLSSTWTVISVDHNPAFSFSWNFTLSAWIRPTSYHTIGYYSLQNLFMSSGPASTYNYALQATDSGTISFIKRTWTEWLAYYSFTGIPSMTNRWTNIVVTVWNYTSGSNTVKLYVDGKYFGTQNTTEIGPGSWDVFQIWWMATDIPETLFQGSLDEMRVYKRVLSDSEIVTLYNSTK